VKVEERQTQRDHSFCDRLPSARDLFLFPIDVGVPLAI
jgi:hypothetical protein